MSNVDSRGTFTPDPGSAPLIRQVAAQAGMEAKLMLRNGEQLLLAVVIPVLVLVGGVEAAKHIDLKLDQRPIDALTRACWPWRSCPRRSRPWRSPPGSSAGTA